MIQLVPVGLSMFALLVAAQSGGALVGERTDGLHRVCSYEDRVHGRLAPSLDVQIGLGEPCPFQYPRPRQPAPSEIPSMATLEVQRHEGGQTICRYVYLGVRYNRPIAEGLTCPYTPNFSD